MLRFLREWRKERKKKGKILYRTDPDGRALIPLQVREDSGFLSPYSTGEGSVISGETAEFLEHSLYGIPAEKEVCFRISSDAITQEEAKEYTAAIHRHYEKCENQAIYEKKRLHRVAFFMALVALLALGAVIALDFSSLRGEVLSEVIDIFAWVFMWEAVDIFFFECLLLKMKQKRYRALSRCLVEYRPLDSRETEV